MRTRAGLPTLALVGRPNVGKSTLFNRLTGTRNALVADYAGLTRDRQYGVAAHADWRFIVVDTGGLMPDDSDPLAALAESQARITIDEADRVLLLLGARSGITADDRAIAEFGDLPVAPVEPVRTAVQRGLPLVLRQMVGLAVEIAAATDHIALGEAKGVIFTSANAVATCIALGFRHDLPAYCVGKATADAAARAGWQAECLGETAADLVDSLRKKPPASPLLHLHGKHTRGNVAATLSAAGLPTSGLVIYDQILQPLSTEARQVLSQGPAIVPLFSPRTARQFVQLVAPGTNIQPVAISPAVAEALQNNGFVTTVTARRPDARNMIAAIETSLDGPSWVEGAPGAQ